MPRQVSTRDGATWGSGAAAGGPARRVLRRPRMPQRLDEDASGVRALTDDQRKILEEAGELGAAAGLIPPGRNYAEQKNVEEGETQRTCVHHNHGLRHEYALDRYETLTGRRDPLRAGRLQAD